MKPLHFGWYWQGVHLRVVGVCDSKSLVFASDVITRELNDQTLSEVCRFKSNGSSLSALGDLGECHR
jgi:hypothetical protein